MQELKRISLTVIIGMLGIIGLALILIIKISPGTKEYIDLGIVNKIELPGEEKDIHSLSPEAELIVFGTLKDGTRYNLRVKKRCVVFKETDEKVMRSRIKSFKLSWDLGSKNDPSLISRFLTENYNELFKNKNDLLEISGNINKIGN